MRQIKVFIIGGGLGGLCLGIYLAKQGIPILLMEKKKYPFHRVCGEYISNEVVPFLMELGIDPFELGASKIQNLEVTSVQGKKLAIPLDLGGFGISRYTLDEILFKKLVGLGAEVILEEKVSSVHYLQDYFLVKDSKGEEYQADYVMGTYGKRSNLDAQLKRDFLKIRSPYLGLKYHLRWDMPKNLIQLHNFHKGYAGLSAIENGLVNFCILTENANLKSTGSIRAMEKAYLVKNPFLKNLYDKAEFIWEKPLVINEISFGSKTLIQDHVIMCGDAAGVISPLCGNGMAMAIHSAKLLGDSLIESKNEVLKDQRNFVEKTYLKKWNLLFKKRLWAGRQIQKLFGNNFMTHQSLSLLEKMPKLSDILIRSTHGIPF